MEINLYLIISNFMYANEKIIMLYANFMGQDIIKVLIKCYLAKSFQNICELQLILLSLQVILLQYNIPLDSKTFKKESKIQILKIIGTVDNIIICTKYCVKCAVLETYDYAASYLLYSFI